MNFDDSSTDSVKSVDKILQMEVAQEAFEAFINESEKQHILTTSIIKNIKQKELAFINHTPSEGLS